eukprot:835294-Amphidinium_carterae.1
MAIKEKQPPLKHRNERLVQTKGWTALVVPLEHPSLSKSAHKAKQLRDGKTSTASQRPSASRQLYHQTGKDEAVVVEVL